MKKILIASHCMELGGAERSLLGILNAMDYQKYEVDLFLYRHTGELLKYIPKEVNLLPEDKQMSMLAIPFQNVIKKGQFSMALGRYRGKKKALQFNKENVNGKESMVMLDYSHKYTVPYVKKRIHKTYDLAISFLTPHYIGVHKVRAKKRIAWIHTDYSSVQVNVESELTMWDAYDYIASISNSVTKSFLKVFPSLADKILLIENILPEKLIFNQAEAFSVDSEMLPKGIKILSIGRFCKAKNFDSVPDICTRLIHFGLDVYWYIIGFGSDEQLIRRRIAECGMENRVILLGKKENPYPYIKACDLYVQPSRYEGKCVTVREAQMLGKPVVITNYETAKSQLENGVDGIIVPLDNQNCAEGILNLLKCDGLLDALVSNCRKRDYSNANEVKKVYRILENE